ncbi:MAG: hypothetical protein K2J05_06210 [Muribaculaceae bacterium]|nr:hypothetical protein [Muribaculaceae bacterium]
MKKTFSFLFMALVAIFVMTSCGGADKAAEVAKKIQAGDSLTQSEYTVVIDYLGSFAEKAQPIQDQINNLPYGDPKAAGLQQQLDKLKESDTYLDIFKAALAKAPQATLGADNVALVNKYAGYEWFTAPDWANVTTDPAAAGIELQSPASDTSAVVAGAVDELKIKE